MLKQAYTPKETLLWSIAFPGFGQFLNGKQIKGVTFIFLELLINVQAKINSSIIHSFQGDINNAVHVLDYQWAMFYPCLYIFSLFDSYCDALHRLNINKPKYIAIPFAVSTYITTIGLIYSNRPFSSLFLGPIFQPILAMIIGFLIGLLIRNLLLYSNKKTFTP